MDSQTRCPYPVPFGEEPHDIPDFFPCLGLEILRDVTVKIEDWWHVGLLPPLHCFLSRDPEKYVHLWLQPAAGGEPIAYGEVPGAFRCVPCVGVLDLGTGSEDAHQPHLGPYPGGLVPGAGVQVDDVRLDRVRACGLLGCSRWRCRDPRQGQKGDGDGDQRTDGPAWQQWGVLPVPLCANTVQHRRAIAAVPDASARRGETIPLTQV